MFQFGTSPLYKSKPDKLVVYVGVEVKDIHFNRPVGGIANCRADAYIQHTHIGFSVEGHPYGINAIRRNEFVRIVHT